MRVLSISKGRTSVGASCEAQGSWLVLVDFNGVRRVVPCWEQLRYCWPSAGEPGALSSPHELKP